MSRATSPGFVMRPNASLKYDNTDQVDLLAEGLDAIGRPVTIGDAA